MAEEMSSESVGYQDGLWAFLQENHVCEERDGGDECVEEMDDANSKLEVGNELVYDTL